MFLILQIRTEAEGRERKMEINIVSKKDLKKLKKNGRI